MAARFDRVSGQDELMYGSADTLAQIGHLTDKRLDRCPISKSPTCPMRLRDFCVMLGSILGRNRCCTN